MGITAVLTMAIGGIAGCTTLLGRAADDTPPAIATIPMPTTTVGAPSSTPVPAYQIVEDEIDRALDEHHRSTVGTTETDAPPAGFAPDTPAMPAPRPAYLIIEDEIERALAERRAPGDAGG